MRLKKLTVAGFKSFADKIVLDFDCEIIGIVGPNGCGKSNIVDAFRWVMGEQSAKSLRGDKMHDVLFAGSDHRKPSHYAEVSVTLTDIDGHLPVPYEELTITRRLYRDGESEYLINKESVRLKDIHELFLGSGLGKNAFSIFEQGKLDQIIHLNPLERRAIFDEAAGTSRFLLRKKETVRKLTGVTENFSRVRDVHAEIETRAKQLKKQASHAKSYQENATLLEELEKTVLILRWKKIDHKESSALEKLGTVTLTFQEKHNEIQALEGALTQAKQGAQQEEFIVKEHQKELHLSETKLRVHETEMTQQKHRVLEINKRQESVKGHVSLLREEQERREGEIEKHERELQQLTFNADLKESVKRGRVEHLKAVQEEGRLRSDLQKRLFNFESKVARLRHVHAHENKQKSALQALEEQVTGQKEKLTTLTTDIDTFKEEMDLLEKDLHLLRKQLELQQKEEHSLMRHMTEAEGHHKALNRLKEEMEGFSPGAKALLKEEKSEKSPLYKKVTPLFEFLIPHKGYEELLASSMRPYVETLVVDSEEELSLLLDVAKKKKITDFAVVIRDKIEGMSGGKEGTLAEHIENNEVAEHFTKGFKLAAEGDFYDPLGVYVRPGPMKKLNNAFYRQAELRSLIEALDQLRAQAVQAAELKESSVQKLRGVEKRRSELSEVRRKKEMDLVQENFTLQRALADLEKLKVEISGLEKEKRDLSHLDEEEKEIKVEQERVHTLQKGALDLLHALQAQEILLEKWQNLHQQTEILKAQRGQSAQHEKKMVEEIEELRLRVETTLKGITKQEQEEETLLSTLKNLRSVVKDQEKKLLECRKSCDTLEKELQLKRKAINVFEKEIHALEITLAQDLAEKKALELELLERHSFPSESISQQDVPLEASVDEMMQEIHRLRTLLASAGAVNMTAIDEFQETQARFDFLDAQLKDLEESKKDLEEIIAKLELESRKIFKKTFQQIRENFQKNFAILFKGGVADLTFTESVDILEAGIDIVAKPPGKQMRSISLLSGGEKCLTALALLFSIFEVKPAPFCILDEVDAPLDDSNIDRFTEVLKQFIEKTQFVIVTHNKKTMAIADLLIGVSMEEKGVSKLISLSFTKNTGPALV